jgi:hypothetical protein
VAAVDLTGDDDEPHLAVRLNRLEADIERDPLIEDAVLTLSLPDDPALTPCRLNQRGEGLDREYVSALN